MRIGLCGAGGVGKTTVAKILSERLNWVFQPSKNREVFKQFGYTTEADQNALTAAQLFELQMAIWKRKIADDTDYDQQYKYIVCDRTPMDNYAYLQMRCVDSVNEENMRELTVRTQQALHKYDYVFYFPLVTFPGQEDGMRESSWGKRNLMDILLRDAVARFRFPIQNVPVMPPLARAKHIATHLGVLREFEPRGS